MWKIQLLQGNTKKTMKLKFLLRAAIDLEAIRMRTCTVCVHLHSGIDLDGVCYTTGLGNLFMHQETNCEQFKYVRQYTKLNEGNNGIKL